MPRGIPNASRDDSALRFTSFHVPLAPNPKHVGSTYLKSDSQTLWSRNSARASHSKSKGAPDEAGASVPVDTRRGAKVVVIHPGSRYLKVGRALDVTPLMVPNVIARRQEPPAPEPVYVEGVSRPSPDRARATQSTNSVAGDEYAVVVASDDPFDTKIAAITISLRDRMRFYKLRVTANAASIATTFNEQFKPEIIPELNDPYYVDWIKDADAPCLVGEKALRIADPESMGYVVRWPFYGGNFNTRDYPSVQLLLSDVETVFRAALKEKDITSYQDLSVVLVIPDFYDRYYVEALTRILLIDIGFKQLCVQQESLAATFGAGISNACVVDMGAVKTSIACVDDGLVLADTRMALGIGGNDITEFLYVMLQKVGFPYREVNLAKAYDWGIMEDLKSRLCTLAEGDVALNLYDFFVRRPDKPTEKYGLRAYDEIILAPMCLFEPRVIEFVQKRAGMRSITHPDVSEEIVEQVADHVSQAMIISTQHLLPAAIPVTVVPADPAPSAAATNPAPSPSAAQGSATGTPKAEPAATEDVPIEEEAPPAAAADVKDGDVEMADATATTNGVVTPAVDVVAEPPAEAPVEVIDVDDLDTKPVIVEAAPLPASQAAPHIYPGGYSIDVCFEASKLPLDVAIFNSARSAGGDEKIRKYLQAVLVIGGTALTPGMAHALESRLQAIATPLVPNMEKVQVIPPPKDVDPRVLAWKGAAVLGRMDGVADLWITASDWDMFGMRALKERCFHL